MFSRDWIWAKQSMSSVADSIQLIMFVRLIDEVIHYDYIRSCQFIAYIISLHSTPILSLLLLFSLLSPNCPNAFSPSTPTFILHGYGDSIQNTQFLTKQLELKLPNQTFINTEVLFGPYSAPLESGERYIRAFAHEIMKHAQGAECINLIGHSQGGFITRAYIQLYSGRSGYPSVGVAISIAGVLRGIDMSIYKDDPQSPPVQWLMKTKVGRQYILAASYDNDPYQNASEAESVLSILKGESKLSPTRLLDGKRVKYAVGREQIIQLSGYFCFYSDSDDVIAPYQSSRFDFFRPDSDEIERVEDTDLYKNDNFGLKTLDQENKLHRIQINNYLHTDYVENEEKSERFVRNCLVPALTGGDMSGCD